LNLLSAAYGTGARLRRTWYERHPDRVRRLSRPVVSVGNLTVGGSGKTPIVAALATLLASSGERPVILSRGYARKPSSDAVVIVSDGQQVLAAATESGDEPQMLARGLGGVPVVVGADRFAAGRLAQSRFDPTVFLLDDGFQHVQLARDVDLLVASTEDLEDAVLPVGRLREPLRAAVAADAVLVYGSSNDAQRVARELGVAQAFTVTREYGGLRSVTTAGAEAPALRKADAAEDPIDGTRVLAVAGIARPDRFFSALQSQGREIVGEVRFRDHHWFTDKDVERIAVSARECEAEMVITTEKDAMRMATLPSLPIPIAYLPMRVVLEPAFAPWLASRLRDGVPAR
jgi:tetraacyldisaccharide 4'-kinase